MPADLARRRIAAAKVPVQVIGLSSEKIPVADESFDLIGGTFTLGTIPDISSALLEMRRALKPDGRLHFVEHGQAADPQVLRWQRRLNPIQQLVFGGCHLDRPISKVLEEAGFEIERLEHHYIQGAPRFAGLLYRGVATRRRAD